MNYKKIYNDFITDRRAKESTLTGYTEKHHIKPKSLGGDNSKENLIRLTAEDHVHAHLLLAKAYGGKQWLSVKYSFSGFTRSGTVPSRTVVRALAISKEKIALLQSSRLNEICSDSGFLHVRTEKLKEALKCPIAREKMGAANRGKKWSDERKSNFIHHGKGKTLSEETRQKISLSLKGKKLSEETKLKLSEARKGSKMPDHLKAILAAVHLGSKRSLETRAKISEAAKARNKTQGDIK